MIPVFSASDEWNDSLSGDFLWNNTNYGEAVTEVMTPLTWSVIQFTLEDWVYIPGFATIGIIGGFLYLNISVFATVFQMLGRSRNELLNTLESTLYMHLPDEMQIPTIPTSRGKMLTILMQAVRTQINQRRGLRHLPDYLNTNQEWFDRTKEQISQEKSKAGLVTLWEDEINDHIRRGAWTVLGIADSSANYTMRLQRDLRRLVGPEDASLLIGSVSMDFDLLQSLGPLVGLTQVVSGEITREEYLKGYGHRGPHEFELSCPRPVEDTAWLDRELAKFHKEPLDVEGMLARQADASSNAWRRFKASYPHEAKKMHRRLVTSAQGARQREKARSEYVRDRWLVRIFALQAGELTGLGNDIFFLRLGEILEVLSEKVTSIQNIQPRKEMYQRLKALPTPPSVIRGQFDPFQWAADPHRRSDIFGMGSDIVKEPSPVITGSPGSTGQVEGIVRILEKPEDGDQLVAGEILVAVQTDIAWTMIFPRAAAVVTDVGAPLSHAAIVARELGIPAVVGCGDATMRLKTGDRVRLDGAKGTVEIIEQC